MARTGRGPRGEYTFPKADGRQRPLGIAALEDKIVQHAIARVLETRGQAIVAIHNKPALGTSFFGDATRIDIEEGYSLKLADAAGLRLSQRIGSVYGQQVFLLKKPGQP